MLFKPGDIVVRKRIRENFRSRVMQVAAVKLIRYVGNPNFQYDWVVEPIAVFTKTDLVPGSTIPGTPKPFRMEIGVRCRLPIDYRYRFAVQSDLDMINAAVSQQLLGQFTSD